MLHLLLHLTIPVNTVNLTGPSSGSAARRTPGVSVGALKQH